MRYYAAKYADYQREAAYRIYVTDSLYLQGQGKAFSRRYSDLIKPAAIDTRTGDEIAEDIIKKLGITVI